MDIKKIIREEIEKLNEEIQSDLVLPKGKRVVLQADNPKVNRGLVVTWLEDGGYNVEYWYKDPSKIYPAEVVIDGKPITTDGKVVYLGYHPELDEGFGSDEFLTKTEKKKFEKERLENAEVLGYTLTGTKDIKESINEAPKKATVDMMKALLKFGDPMPKPIWNALTMMVRGYGLEYVKREVKKNPKDFYKNLKQMARAFPEFSKKPKNYKFNEASLTIPQYKTSIKKLSHSQQDKLFNLLHKLKLMKLIDFINYRDGSLHIAKSSITPKIKKDIEKKFKISLKESVNEARLDPKQLLQQLGGNRFIAMTGAKNLAVDKSKNELHMKIMRNAKGISHVRIRLTSMDLYDMEFLQVRAGRIKIKSKEKGVYADQLGKMFKKNTGMNVRL